LKSYEELKGIQNTNFEFVKEELSNLFDSKINSINDLNKNIFIDKYFYSNFNLFYDQLLEYCKDYDIKFKIGYFTSRNECDYYIIFSKAD
jgi:hypothetical protein